MDAKKNNDSQIRKLIMWYKVKQLASNGLNKTQISEQVGLYRGTVRHYLKMSEEEFLHSESYKREYNHKLDPYEGFVKESLEGCHTLSASQIHDWLKERYENFPQVNQNTAYNFVQFIRRKCDSDEEVQQLRSF